ncbi:unnamed protein product [Dovyalis caffra]|uniref:Uncharacterized protein n=1 Tax=Dovyalis caffra TaxID=77055 RepID=A0AAV1QVH6_9ROSI|nr:unnamed protein product [Dovyalis caffra]
MRAWVGRRAREVKRRGEAAHSRVPHAEGVLLVATRWGCCALGKGRTRGVTRRRLPLGGARLALGGGQGWRRIEGVLVVWGKAKGKSWCVEGLFRSCRSLLAEDLSLRLREVCGSLVGNS